MQAANRAFRQLISFRNPQPFDPKNASVGSNRDDQAMALGPLDFGICEQILQFYRRFHTDWLKPITRVPMADKDSASNPAGIELFGTGLAFGRT